MNDNGFIILHRKMLEWEWIQDPIVPRVWLYCLLRANWQESKWKGVLIPRGSFVSSYSVIAEDLRIGRQSVRTACHKLKSTSNLTIKSTSKYTMYHIVKYDEYQNKDLRLTIKSTSNLTNEQPTTNQRLTTDNNNNKVTRITNINTGFEEFWGKYLGRNGIKGSKQEALREWNKLTLEEQTFSLSALERQKEYHLKCRDADIFVAQFPDACRWLKNKRFMDEIGPIPKASNEVDWAKLKLEMESKR